MLTGLVVPLHPARSVSPPSTRTRLGPPTGMVLRILRIVRSVERVCGEICGRPILADVVANRTQGPRREADAGLGQDPDEVWTEYADPGRDPCAPLCCRC